MPSVSEVPHPSTVYSGGFNTNRCFGHGIAIGYGPQDLATCDDSDSEYPMRRFDMQALYRIERDCDARQCTMDSLRLEYEAIGADDYDVGFRPRSMPEQARYMMALRMARIDVPIVLAYSHNSLVMEYVSNAHPLNDVVGNDTPCDSRLAVKDALANLRNIHDRGIVLGDRWCKNTLCTEGGGVVELDFDIQLLGDHNRTATFEMAQTLYHLLHFAGRKSDTVGETVIKNWHAQNSGLYIPAMLKDIVIRQAEYFSHQDEYEGLPPHQVGYVESFLNEL